MKGFWLSSCHRYITNQLNDLLSVCLLAQFSRALNKYHWGEGLESRTSFPLATAKVSSVSAMIFLYLIPTSTSQFLHMNVILLTQLFYSSDQWYCLAPQSSAWKWLLSFPVVNPTQQMEDNKIFMKMNMRSLYEICDFITQSLGLRPNKEFLWEFHSSHCD